MATCSCIAHEFARHWLPVTSDSYIVHSSPVVGAEGAGAYLAKYMTKTFDTVDDRLASIGMARRWSSSRGWPGRGRLRLLHSESAGGAGWDKIRFELVSKDLDKVLADVNEGKEHLLTHTGDDLTWQRKEKFTKARAQRYLERQVHVQ